MADRGCLYLSRRMAYALLCRFFGCAAFVDALGITGSRAMFGHWRFVVLLAPMLVCSAHGAALDQIRERGAITFGYVESAVPFSFVDRDKNPQGYSVELCREIANGIRTQLGLSKLDVRWIALTLQNRLEAVRTRRVDIDCSTSTWTLSRQKEVDFSLITFLDGATVLTYGAKDLFRLADYNGKRIAVVRGTTTVGVLQTALQMRSLAAELVPVSSRPEGLELLRAGKIDGFASDRIVLMGLVQNEATADRFRLLDDDFSIEQYALALPRGDSDFRLAVNRVLARLYRTGDIMQIYDRWLGRYGRPSTLLYATYFVQSLSE